MALTHWVSAGDVPRFRAAMESLGTPLDTDDQLLDALEKQFGFGGDLVDRFAHRGTSQTEDCACKTDAS